MKKGDKIEKLFNEAFSNWEADVPNDLKSSIDDELFLEKPGVLSRFKYALIGALLLIISGIIYVVKTPDSTLYQPNQTFQSNQSISSDSEIVLSNKKTNSQTASKKQKPILDTFEIDNNQEQKDSFDVTSSPNNKSNRVKNNRVKTSPFKAQIIQSASFPQKSLDSPIFDSAIQAKNKDKIDFEGHQEFYANKIKMMLDSNEAATNQRGKAAKNDQKTFTNGNSEGQVALHPLITKDSIIQDSTLKIVEKSLSTKNTHIFSEEIAPNAFYLGMHVGTFTGRNNIQTTNGTLDEKRNYAIGFDASYQFKNNQMVSTGLFYQHRKENFINHIIHLDSVYSHTDTLFQTIVNPNTNDTITIISGVQDVYVYDTTSSNFSAAATIRIALVPIAYDWRFFKVQNHQFWVQSGLSLGLYQSNIASLSSTEQRTRFAMQAFLRPSYIYNLGRWRAGIFGNIAYDLLLPQTWMNSRQRWQTGFGFQIQYRL
jgi:hypothetical protein